MAYTVIQKQEGAAQPGATDKPGAVRPTVTGLSDADRNRDCSVGVADYKEKEMIINLTQHPATADQIAVGVVDLPADQRARLCALLTFDALPKREEIEDAAEQIALLADAILPEEGDHAAMIGGAPWLMAPLERALLEQRIRPVYAFSVRESVEQTLPDGSVMKVNVFRHAGFVQ